MRIITKGVIMEFAKKHIQASIPLNDWYRKTMEANWNNFNEVRNTFNTADYVGNDRYVFNIGGNNFRLVAMIHFKVRTVYIRRILTHVEYTVLSKGGNINLL